MEEESSPESPFREPPFAQLHHSLPKTRKIPSYLPLIQVHPWYTDPEGIAITLGESSYGFIVLEELA